MRAALAALMAALVSATTGCALVTDLNAHDYSIEQTGAVCTSVGSASGQLTSGNATCDSCLAAQCCGSVTSCFAPGQDGGLGECAQLELCFVGCLAADAGACRAGCIGSYLGGLAGAATLSSCAASSCASSSCGAF
jgi:hypothetical protein